MYLPQKPSIRELTVFSEMPSHFRRTGVRSNWADANQSGRAIDSFLEGPVVDDAGHLYVCDIPFGRVFKITPDGSWSLVAEYDGEPNGMKLLNQATLLITDYRLGLIALDIATGRISPFLSRRNSESFKGLNDLTIDSHGNIYFTDQGQTGLHDPTGRVYRLRPARGGEPQRLDLLLDCVPSPNGIVLSVDEKVLFVACTRGNCVWRMPLQTDGSVSKVGQFFTSYGTSGPDGLAMDQSGRLFVANPGLGYVWIINARGEPVEVLHAPRVDGELASISLTNIAFGGPSKKRLYCTDSSHGRILMVDMDTAGCLYGEKGRTGSFPDYTKKIV
jgi:gluconolactonase